MRTRLRVLIIAAVVGLSIWTIHPFQQTIPLGLDLAGGVQLILRVKTEGIEPAKRSETVEQAIQIIERRVNALGVAEPVVARYGGDDRILVQRGEPMATVVDVSVNQTLSRTVITAGATLMSVLALYAFGGETLRGFAFTMLIGIVSGTYSTVFIASSLATGLRKDRRR